EAVVASEGCRAIDLITSRPPSLVILDLMLPDMDGLDILKTLRQEERTARLPVILLTARAEEADRVLGLEIGADDYVVKPFSPRELMLRVGKLISSRTAAAVEPKLPTVFGVLEIDEDRFRVTVEGRP